jgi:hypothetical protein
VAFAFAAGRAGDPFWIEPDVLHAVGHALQDGTTLNLGDWTPARAKNLFAWQTVYSMVLEVPDQDLLAELGDGHRVGVWAVSMLATDAGGWRSINRVGLPMLPPLFTQYDEDLGDRLNAGCPSGDFKKLRRSSYQSGVRRCHGQRYSFRVNESGSKGLAVAKIFRMPLKCDVG